jgi:glycosyltransferase involved in cell wall biosynthesis
MNRQLLTFPPQQEATHSQPRVAVILPCYNEAVTIGHVVRRFRNALPDAHIYVCDNNSSDETALKAREAGAEVLFESYRGKGNAVRRLFSDVEADIYVMADGDGTYDASTAPALIEMLRDRRLAMINGARNYEGEGAFRSGHKFGNRLLTGLVHLSFGNHFQDMLSGYRVMSRRFVKSFPALSDGFEIETELTVHALHLRLPCAEVETPYFARPEGSTSKLNTFRDGFRILRVIARLVRDEKPLEFFSAAGAMLALLALGLIVPILLTYMETGLVPRFPTLIGAVALGIVATLSVMAGLILDTLSRARVEQRRLAYLACPVKE